jgi:hypothetical protein
MYTDPLLWFEITLQLNFFPLTNNCPLSYLFKILYVLLVTFPFPTELPMLH